MARRDEPRSDGPAEAIDAARRSLDQAQRHGVAEPLLRCARLLDEVALARLHAATGMALRPAHTALFPHIDLEGVRLTELAARLGVSKQAVAPLVDELVAMGALERVADPRDGRAKLLRFGRAPAAGTGGLEAADAARSHGLVHGLAMLAALEAELRAEVGDADWTALQRALQALLPALQRRLGGER